MSNSPAEPIRRPSRARRRGRRVAAVVTIVLLALWGFLRAGPTLGSACDGLDAAAEVGLETPDGAARPLTSGQSEGVVDRLRDRLGPDSGAAIFCGDFADPFVFRSGPFLYAYATNTLRANVPVMRSVDGVHGRELDDALPALPAWSEPGWVWAPAVLERDDGFVLYYTTRDTASGRQCVSTAVGSRPEGPFVDDSARPLICPVDLGGAIDASPFVDDDGSLVLLWKNDGNAIGVPTTLWAQPMTDDGLSTAEEPRALLSNEADWEGAVVEAPSMIRHDGTHHLFYSANAFDTERYSIGHATCDTPLGPCARSGDGPWLASGGRVSGPGGAEVFHNEVGDPWIVFHGWLDDDVGYAHGVRSLFAVRLAFEGDVPTPDL